MLYVVILLQNYLKIRIFFASWRFFCIFAQNNTKLLQQ